MKQTTIQTLYAYWDSVRAGRIAPRRLDIEPAGIATILAETFMLECEEGDYRYRLAGSRLCELFGYELRGSSFLAGWSKEDLAFIEQQLALICSEGAAAHFAIKAGGDHRIELEILLLPLLHTGDRIGRMIGAMSATSQPQWNDKGCLASRCLLRHQVVGLPDKSCSLARPNHESSFAFLLSVLDRRYILLQRISWLQRGKLREGSIGTGCHLLPRQH
jgi:hypothetical protein